MNFVLRSFSLAAVATTLTAGISLADGYQGPPFDFSDSFYLANGVNPRAIAGRPTGSGPNSVIDNRENGPNFNNIRLLSTSTAYDHSGHRIFFNVTGLPNAASFTNNSAGVQARQIADQYKVYEFPKATNAPFAVFPKRQDLMADLRNGYFSHDVLGTWQINLVRFTPAATGTPAGQAALAALAAQNGLDNDGTPIIKTIDQLESLRSSGYVTITVPAADGSQGLRWFFCPVLNDPRNGVIAPDAHVDVTENSDAATFRALFTCLQTTGTDSCTSGHRSDCDRDGRISAQDIFTYLGWFFAQTPEADFDGSGTIEPADIFNFLSAWFAGV